MKEADKMIKNNLYKLQIISGGASGSELLDRDELRVLDLAKGVPFLCKIKIAEMRPPLTIHMKYLEGDANLKMFGSLSKTEPN